MGNYLKQVFAFFLQRHEVQTNCEIYTHIWYFESIQCSDYKTHNYLNTSYTKIKKKSCEWILYKY